MKNIAVLYHASCPDGFGGAYSAWKKLGSTADYISVYHGTLPPDLAGKEVYIIDFSYPNGKMLQMEKSAKRLVVLDHHEGVEDEVRQVREHVYDATRSGTGIAWEYFHPGTPVPRLLQYIQDADLWKWERPYAKEVAAFVGSLKFDFELFDPVVQKADTEEGFAEIVSKGKAYKEYFDYVCDNIIEQAQEIEFEGYNILAVSAPRLFRSAIGMRLAKIKGPLAIVYYPHHGKWHFSMRGDGSIDLSKVAQKHGGNGHPNSASFQLPLTSPLPFTFVKK